jgi:hypothetical protein
MSCGIVSKPSTDEYRKGWERIFGKDETTKDYPELKEGMIVKKYTWEGEDGKQEWVCR